MHPGAAYFSIHIRSIIVNIGLQVHIEVMNKPRIKDTRPPIFLKDLIYELELVNLDVRSKDSTLYHYLLMTAALGLDRLQVTPRPSVYRVDMT